MHPRVSVNDCVLGEAPLRDALELWSALGSSSITVSHRKLQEAGWDEAIRSIAELGIPVASIVHGNVFTLADPSRWDGQREALSRTLEAARLLGATCVYTTTGSGGGLPWDEAAAAFAAAIAPQVEQAAAGGVRLLCETTNSLTSDISIAHTLPGLLDLADRSGVRLCIDFFHCWNEAHLDRWLAEAAPRADLAQVCDVVIGDRSLTSRAVPGDGDVQIERMLRILVDSGFEGIFDLEMRGPRIEAEGSYAAARRAAAWLSDALKRIGA